MIQSTWWMMMDMDQPVIVDRLFIYGTLELDPAKPHTLQANLIMVSGLHGMLIAGWPNETMPNDVIIRLTGEVLTSFNQFQPARIVKKRYSLRNTI